jgi:hypothetical protein
MHTMFIRKMQIVDNNIFPACKPSPHAFICFEDEGFESALGKMKRGSHSRDPAADDESIVVIVHPSDYSGLRPERDSLFELQGNSFNLIRAMKFYFRPS